jgi:dihydroneopterin aldolase
MKLESAYIYLEKLRFYSYHGVMPQERIVGGEYEVDLRVEYPFDEALRTDDVADTLNYASLYQLVEHEMSVPSRLLEHVAGRIARSVFKNMPRSKAVDIKISKKNPPMGADIQGAGVELHLINDKTTL